MFRLQGRPEDDTISLAEAKMYLFGGTGRSGAGSTGAVF